MSDTLKNIIKHLLLAFVFLSIGFSLGKEFAKKSFKESKSENETYEQTQKTDNVKKVVVYYMHSTFRCPTCNEIERLTKELIEKDFSEQLSKKSLEFRSVNFQKDEELAKRYKIATGCVVVAKIADGKDLDFKILEEVWTLYNNPPKFKEYVEAPIKDYLESL